MKIAFFCACVRPVALGALNSCLRCQWLTVTVMNIGLVFKSEKMWEIKNFVFFFCSFAFLFLLLFAKGNFTKCLGIRERDKVFPLIRANKLAGDILFLQLCRSFPMSIFFCCLFFAVYFIRLFASSSCFVEQIDDPFARARAREYIANGWFLKFANRQIDFNSKMNAFEHWKISLFITCVVTSSIIPVASFRSGIFLLLVFFFVSCPIFIVIIIEAPLAEVHIVWLGSVAQANRLGNSQQTTTKNNNILASCSVIASQVESSRATTIRSAVNSRWLKTLCRTCMIRLWARCERCARLFGLPRVRDASIHMHFDEHCRWSCVLAYLHARTHTHTHMHDCGNQKEKKMPMPVGISSAKNAMV